MTDEAQPLRPDGYYWTRYVPYDSVLVLLYRDGEWHDTGVMPEPDIEVLAGPLTFPTPEELAGQAAHFAEQCRLQAAFYEIEDPIWNDVVEGAYWVRRQDKTEPEIAHSFEGHWGSLCWDEDQKWASSMGEPNPEVLFGPLVPPPGYRRFEP